MATIRTIASEADVSIATVSRVLSNKGEAVSEDVRQRVLGVADRLGYSGIRHFSANYVALTYTGPGTINSAYDTALMRGMSAAAGEQGMDFAVIRLPSDRRAGESYAQLLHRKGVRCCGLRTTTHTRQICMELTQDGFPCMVIGERFDEEPVSYIYGDSRTSSIQAVEHLIALGHRRIAIAVSAIADNDHNDRLAGYEQALKGGGIEADPKLIFRVPALRPDGAQVLRSLMSMSERPTAIFVADPLVAVGAINQAHEMGLKIPEDVSLIGFDDTDTRDYVYPRMSAICQDARQLGYDAAASLVRQMENPGQPIRKAVPTWLELHATTGRPPDQLVRVLPDGSRLIEPLDAPAST